MSEQFDTSTSKKRRMGQRMKEKERIATQAAFLESYVHTANILVSAKALGIDRTLVYYWQEHDEAFDFAFKLADKEANLMIEAEIHRRAIVGLDKPLVSMGKLVYETVKVDGKRVKQKVMITEYSDTLLMFYAKRRMPEYRDKGMSLNVILPKEYVNLPEDGTVME